MTEEEYFRKNYPNSCYGDKPLSPHWDFFQDGVEFGERQSEKRIAELEVTNKNISNECHKLVDSLEKKQNEVAELKKQLRDKKCNDKDCPVFIKLIQANKENAELKELVEKYRQAVDKCLHITFMGGGCEVNTIGQYATLVDGYLTDVEGLAKWKD